MQSRRIVERYASSAASGDDLSDRLEPPGKVPATFDPERHRLWQKDRAESLRAAGERRRTAAWDRQQQKAHEAREKRAARKVYMLAEGDMRQVEYSNIMVAAADQGVYHSAISSAIKSGTRSCGRLWSRTPGPEAIVVADRPLDPRREREAIAAQKRRAVRLQKFRTWCCGRAKSKPDGVFEIPLAATAKKLGVGLDYLTAMVKAFVADGTLVVVAQQEGKRTTYRLNGSKI